MTDATKQLDADAWLRRLEQDFSIGMEGAKALSTFISLPVVGLEVTLTPLQPYGPKVLTFRGVFKVTSTRECVVSLEEFDETVEGFFERSYRLSSSAPPVPEDTEEAEDFPYEGLSLLEMLGDELALNITPFPRKPGAVAPEFEETEEEVQEERPNPFAVLQSLKS